MPNDNYATAPAQLPQTQSVQAQLADLRTENDELRARITRLESELSRCLNALGIEGQPPYDVPQRPFLPIL